MKLDLYVMRTCLTRDPKLLAHLIDFVHDCGKLVIAQGVESRQQAQQLARAEQTNEKEKEESHADSDQAGPEPADP